MRFWSPTLKVVIAAVCIGLLLTTTAAAAGYNVATRLTINAPGHVNRGKAFSITGELRSSRSFCRAHSKIKLVKKGVGVIDTATTSRSGDYAFRVTIRAPSRFLTKFAGKVSGVHPNIKTCRASRSDTLRVRAT